MNCDINNSNEISKPNVMECESNDILNITISNGAKVTANVMENESNGNSNNTISNGNGVKEDPDTVNVMDNDDVKESNAKKDNEM